MILRLNRWAFWHLRSPLPSLIRLYRVVLAVSRPDRLCFWRQLRQSLPQNHAEAFVFVHLGGVPSLRFTTFVIQLTISAIAVTLLISHFGDEFRQGLWPGASQHRLIASYLIWGAQFESLALQSLSQTAQFVARKTVCAWRSQRPASSPHLPMF